MNYDIFAFLRFLGSLGIFIFGMKVMSEGLQKIAGGKLRSIFKKIIAKRYGAVFSGFFITSLIQSSSATTVLAVSFTNAGVITLAQSIGIVMGANVGTTITSWLMLLGVHTNTNSLALGLIGVTIPLIFSGIKKWKSFGEFIMGFCLFFLGLEFMYIYKPELQNSLEVIEFVKSYSEIGFSSYLLFVLIGLLATVIIQSSSMSFGIIMIVVSNGWVPIEIAAAMVIGANLGTTTTSLIASIGGNVNSKRVALSHVIFNLVGLIVFTISLRFVLHSIDWLIIHVFEESESIFSTNPYSRGQVIPLGITVFHTLFNVITLFLLFGFVGKIEKILVYILPKNEDDYIEDLIFTEALIETPEVGLVEAELVNLKVFKEYKLAFEKLEEALKGDYNDGKFYIEIKTIVDRTNLKVHRLLEFLNKLAQSNVGRPTYKKINTLQHISRTYLELSKDLLKSALLIQNGNNINIKSGSKKMFYSLLKCVNDCFELTLINYSNDMALLTINEISALEEKMKILGDELRVKHLERIENHKDLIEEGIMKRSLYSKIERIGDNIIKINNILVEVY